MIQEWKHRKQPVAKYGLRTVILMLRSLSSVERQDPSINRNTVAFRGGRQLTRKIRYTPLEALQVFLDEGWQAEIFPWVVIIRGLLDSVAINCCLVLPGIPWKCWRRIIEETAKKSIKPSMSYTAYAAKLSK